MDLPSDLGFARSANDGAVQDPATCTTTTTFTTQQDINGVVINRRQSDAEFHLELVYNTTGLSPSTNISVIVLQ